MRHSLRRDRAAISHHYDVGNDFYALVLGPSLVYSCAYWDDTAVDDAGGRAAGQAGPGVPQAGAAPRHAGARRRLRWGSLVLHAAANYGVRAVGVTLSAEQADLARRRIAEAGLDGTGRDPGAGLPRGLRRALRRHRLGRHGRARRRARNSRRTRPGCTTAGPGGRLLNHAIAARTGAGADPAAPVVPHPLRLPRRRAAAARHEHVGVLERAGFEVRDVESCASTTP